MTMSELLIIDGLKVEGMIPQRPNFFVNQFLYLIYRGYMFCSNDFLFFALKQTGNIDLSKD